MLGRQYLFYFILKLIQNNFIAVSSTIFLVKKKKKLKEEPFKVGTIWAPIHDCRNKEMGTQCINKGSYKQQVGFLGFNFAAFFMAIYLCLMQAQSSKGPMPVLFRDEEDKSWKLSSKQFLFCLYKNKTKNVMIFPPYGNIYTS